MGAHDKTRRQLLNKMQALRQELARLRKSDENCARLSTVSVPDVFAPIFMKAQDYVERYFHDRVEDPQHSTISISGERYILVRAASMSVEFFELVMSLYKDRGPEEARSVANNLLFDLAHAIGKADAKTFHSRMGVTDPIDRLSAGPIHFSFSGWAFVKIQPESSPNPNEDYFLIYDHPFSFEADAWLRHYGKVEFPVCIMNAGYSSGWCEESFGLPLVATEIECQAKGDLDCRFIMAPPSRMEEHVARYFERRHQRIPPAARIAAGPVAVPEFFQRKRMEEALRASEQRFRILAEVIPQIVWTTDASGAVDYLNPRWREYTGVPVEQGLGWDWKAVLHPDDTFHCLSLWREALRTGANFEAEVRFRRASDGVYRWQLGRALPVRDQDGRITKWFGTWTDIDDRKQAEEALRRSEQLAATGRLAATISHEINNPLEGVINLLYLIETHPRVDRSIRDYVEIAQQELARVAHIAKQTLGFYRETNEASPVNLSEILEALLRVYARKIDAKRLKVETRFDFRGNIRAYPGEMRQVFSNVLINALEASPAGGHVKLHVTWAREWNGAGRKGVRVVIADTGPGIRPEHRQRIFEPFFTTKGDKGTGLGLWVTQGIVHKHGGSVRLRSSVHPGRSGTVFSFFLPEAEAEVETYAATMRLAS